MNLLFKNMKKLLSILFIFSFLISCSNEPPPKYEKWGGTALQVYEGTVLGSYIDLNSSKGTTIYGYDVELNEYYRGKICVQKTGINGVYYPSQIENIFIIPLSDIIANITLSDGIPKDMLSKDSTGAYKLNVYEIVTEHGYSNFGQTIATITFNSSAKPDETVEYDIVI